MPQPTTLGSVKTERYYVRIPEETVAEIDGYIKESGMYQAHFLSNALVVWARETAPQRPKSLIAQTVAAERQRLMRRAVGYLAPEQRQLLELAYFEGLSQVEIAARLGQPPGTINVHMRVAMRNLTTLLSSYGLLCSAADAPGFAARVERLLQAEGMTATFGIAPIIDNDLKASMAKAATLVQAAKAKGMRGSINTD